MLSPDGRCKTLDASADGYVRAEACAMMLLAPLDPVSSSPAAKEAPRAIILGAAVNQDGRSSALTAPSGPAQQEVIRAALRDAKLPATALTALQMHGTGEDACLMPGALSFA